MNPEKFQKEAIIRNILEDYHQRRDIDRLELPHRPDKATVIRLLEQLCQIVCPGAIQPDTCHSYSIQQSLFLDEAIRNLTEQIAIVLRCQLEKEAAERDAQDKSLAFFQEIPHIRALAQTDLEAFYAGDPAASSKDEILICYPGFFAITVYRLAHILYCLGIPLLPRILSEYAHSATGIDIHPGATIGKYFFIDHGTGIVVGETTVIGDHVKLYQGVTLGALTTRGGQNLRGKKRHPTIQDHVTIYAGASILGGNTVIGKNCVIGSNVFITHSVPCCTTVSIKGQELQMKSRSCSGDCETCENKPEPFWEDQK